MTLTKRGKRVRAILVTILVITLIYWLNKITTPHICNVPVSHMNQFCKDLLFPR